VGGVYELRPLYQDGADHYRPALGDRRGPSVSCAGSAQAQISGAQLYVEPGTTMLRSPDGSRQVLGKVVIDLQSGKIWGLPTLTEAPYPVNTINSEPPVSHPIYLGRFDFAALNK
jgi:hypothetical protein